MGTANKVPGVSGGLVAYVGGFYAEFINSLQKLNATSFKLLLKGRFSEFYSYINGTFLSLLLLGEAISYFTVSKVFDVLINNFPILVWSLFFGLIIGSVFYLARSYKAWNLKNIGILVLGMIIGVATSLMDPATQNDNLFFVFFCGIISVCGMTLPGLSGSFILILLGNYILLLVDCINAFFDTMVMVFQADFSWWYDYNHMNLLLILFIFILGSIVGLISLSHLLGWTMKKFRNQTNALIIGFITGSLGVVWPWKSAVFKLDDLGNQTIDASKNPILINYDRYLPYLDDRTTWIAILMMGIGFFIVFLLDHYGNKANPA
jgi:uncharacterized membrane protein